MIGQPRPSVALATIAGSDAFHTDHAERMTCRLCGAPGPPPIGALALALRQLKELIVAIRSLTFRGALVHAALPAE